MLEIVVSLVSAAAPVASALIDWARARSEGNSFKEQVKIFHDSVEVAATGNFQSTAVKELKRLHYDESFYSLIHYLESAEPYIQSRQKDAIITSLKIGLPLGVVTYIIIYAGFWIYDYFFMTQPNLLYFLIIVAFYLFFIVWIFPKFAPVRNELKRIDERIAQLKNLLTNLREDQRYRSFNIHLRVVYTHRALRQLVNARIDAAILKANVALIEKYRNKPPADI